MDAKQAFKYGFMAHCVELGYTTPDAIHQFAKRAIDKLAFGVGSALGLDAVKDVIGGAGKVIGGVAEHSVWPLLAAPPLLGMAAGHLASRATDYSDFDPEEAKQEEVINEYKSQAERLKREGQLRKYLGGQPLL